MKIKYNDLTEYKEMTEKKMKIIDMKLDELMDLMKEDISDDYYNELNTRINNLCKIEIQMKVLLSLFNNDEIFKEFNHEDEV